MIVMDDLKRCYIGNDPKFGELWNSICDEQSATERRWVAQLRFAGIKAAHPDDGWVDRKKNEVFLCYPQFNDGLQVGDRLALGSADHHRIVVVTGMRIGGALWNVNLWMFREE